MTLSSDGAAMLTWPFLVTHSGQNIKKIVFNKYFYCQLMSSAVVPFCKQKSTLEYFFVWFSTLFFSGSF